MPFDVNNATHCADLKQLWVMIFPPPAEDSAVVRSAEGRGEGRTEPSVDETNSAPPPLSDDRWKQIGFQSKTPATDFRGGGILGLYCMMYLAEQYPEETRRMIQESQDERTFYLWAAACIK